MKTSRLSLAVLALIGESDAIDHARLHYLPTSFSQMRDVSADELGDKFTGDSADKFDSLS